MVDLDTFRADVRRFIADSLPDDIRETAAAGRLCSNRQIRRWQRILADKGWVAPNWPAAYGGVDWTQRQRAIYEEECVLNHCPVIDGGGIKMVGPLLITHGSPAQQERFLEPTRRGEIEWCQGYSEPGSGSDLASLKTRAVREGDVYVVNGQKIWTTNGHNAEWMFCLVRTDPAAKKQDGISMLLIDMSSPGVTVRPIIALNGVRVFNEVFLDDVRVPVEMRIGEENKGWTYSNDVLADERLGLSRAAPNRGLLQQLKQVAAAERAGGAPLIDKDWFRRKIGRAEIRLLALEAVKEGFLRDLEAGNRLGPEASILKVQGSELIQHLDRLLMEAMGARGLAYDPAWMSDDGGSDLPDAKHAATLPGHRFRHKGYTIAGGTSEVQRMIIAKRVLGL